MSMAQSASWGITPSSQQQTDDHFRIMNQQREEQMLHYQETIDVDNQREEYHVDMYPIAEPPSRQKQLMAFEYHETTGANSLNRSKKTSGAA